MTEPGGRPPEEPPYGSPQYGSPQSGQPQYGSPQYGSPQYGSPQYGQPQYGQPQYGMPAPYADPGQVRNYLVPSILATLFCCLPGGIAAIVFSAQANSKLKVGDVAGAADASRKARLWLIVSVVVGLLGLALYAAGVMASVGRSGGS